MIPLGGVNFDPRAFIWTNVVDTNYKMFHALYLSYSYMGFSKEDFFKFLLYTNKENQWPPPPGGQFRTQGI
jgi:hypothetical protein